MSSISVQDARAQVLRALPPLPSEPCPISHALNRVLSEDLHSEMDVPPWDNSAMDGYAVRFDEVAAATEHNPVVLPIKHEIAAGHAPLASLSAGHAARIMTGAPIPTGADTVVQQEWTELSPDRAFVRIKKSGPRGNHVRRRGEDILCGSTVIEAGELLTPAAIALAASLGCASLPVTRQPRVAILATGDELAEVGTPLTSGQIYSSNTYGLIAAVQEVGGVPNYVGIARDNRESLRALLLKCMASDVVLTTGGVSVGDYDFVKEVLADLGNQMHFWTIAQRPGHPLAFGLLGGKPVFGLPGNPVSTFVSFSLYVRPALLKMQGLRKIFPPVYEASLEEEIRVRAGRTNFLRGYATHETGAWRVRSTGPQGSGVLSSMHAANCLIIVPPEQDHAVPGSPIQIMLTSSRFGWSAEPCF